MSLERLAVFIDGANHSEALRKSKLSMDYGNFVKGLRKSFRLVSARYYSGVSQRDEHKNVRDLLGSVSKSGWSLITKPVREFPDGKVKANMDIEIAVDILTMAPRLDHVMLFSGDGDFRYLVDTVQRMGVTVTVCSHKPTAAIGLRDQSNEFLELRDLIDWYDKPQDVQP